MRMQNASRPFYTHLGVGRTMLALTSLACSYTQSVMLHGVCNMSATGDTGVPQPVRENAHVISTFYNPNYGQHVVVLGRDSKLYHKHQVATAPDSNWTSWKCMTPDLTKVPCSIAPRCGGFDNNPAVAWQPTNGTAVLFVRQIDDVDIHETHLADPADPDSWTPLRAPACICNFPPCGNQTKCGVEKNCDESGVDCDITPTSSRQFWGIGPFFPTSELSLLPQGDKLALHFRGFDGAFYKMLQQTAGDAGGKMGEANRLGGFGDNPTSIIE